MNEHLVDAEQSDMETTLMRMLDHIIQHARRARQEGHNSQDRLEKFEKTSFMPIMPAQPARGAGHSTSSWNVWKGDLSLKPSMLSKDAVPCDFRNFQRDLATYIKSGETATVKATAITIVGHLRVCIDSELNTLMRACGSRKVPTSWMGI